MPLADCFSTRCPLTKHQAENLAETNASKLWLKFFDDVFCLTLKRSHWIGSQVLAPISWGFGLIYCFWPEEGKVWVERLKCDKSRGTRRSFGAWNRVWCSVAENPSWLYTHFVDSTHDRRQDSTYICTFRSGIFWWRVECVLQNLTNLGWVWRSSFSLKRRWLFSRQTPSPRKKSRQWPFCRRTPIQKVWTNAQEVSCLGDMFLDAETGIPETLWQPNRTLEIFLQRKLLSYWHFTQQWLLVLPSVTWVEDNQDQSWPRGKPRPVQGDKASRSESRPVIRSSWRQIGTKFCSTSLRPKGIFFFFPVFKQENQTSGLRGIRSIRLRRTCSF